MRDLDFISGKFFDYEVPSEKRYLLLYFKTDLQKAFLYYYFVFGDFKNFQDHTGYYCTNKVLHRFRHRFRQLSELHDKLKKSLTEESLRDLQLLETGKYRLTNYF